MEEIGRIKFYNSEKGYGFVSHGDSTLFFHINDIRGAWMPTQGLQVSFDVIAGSQGRNKAVNIVPTDKNADRKAVETDLAWLQHQKDRQYG